MGKDEGRLEKQGSAMNSTRIDYMDSVKGVGILLVLFVHFTPVDTLLKGILISFFMPLFFIASGFYFKGGEPFQQFMMKRTRALLVPYFLFALIYAPDLYPSTLVYILYGNYFSLAPAGRIGAIWFLMCMFFAQIIAYFIHWLAASFAQNRRIQVLYFSAVFVVCVLIGWLLRGENFPTMPIEYRAPMHELLLAYGIPFSINIAFMGVAFMLVGKLFRYLLETHLIKHGAWLRAAVGLIVIMLGVFFFILNGAQGNAMAAARYGDLIPYLATACIMSFGVILLCTVIKNKVLAFYGKNTVLMLGLHVVALDYFLVFVAYTQPYINWPEGMLQTLIKTAVVAVALVIPIKVINYYSKFRLLDTEQKELP